MPMVPVGASAFEETEQPQSLKKLSLKSLKRGLDIFSPINGHYAPPDPLSKLMRINNKIHPEYGALRKLSDEAARDSSTSAPQDQLDKVATSSEVLPL